MKFQQLELVTFKMYPLIPIRLITYYDTNQLYYFLSLAFSLFSFAGDLHLNPIFT